MNDYPLGLLFLLLAGLILLSGFFSGSETGMMALNRYRLRHLVDKRHRGAMRASELLKRPDRLIGLILLGNNFVNILASSIATLIGLRLMGEAGLLPATALLTIVVLIFAEVMPKTLAALHPERIAFPASVLLALLLRLFYPLVWLVNLVTNSLLGLMGIRPEEGGTDSVMTREELRTVVKEAEAMIPSRHQKMLMGILDLEKVTVEDIMIPRNEISGIDLEQDSTGLREQLTGCQHTRVPVYHGSLDQTIGILHVRKIPALLAEDDPERFGPDLIAASVVEPYFVPISTPLHTQLFNFQHEKRRLALVVDEFGDIQGMVTLEDILEEIVGEFTTDPQSYERDIYPQPDGSYLIDGSATIRDINRSLKWHLPSKGPKTFNGLILESLESIPQAGTSLRIADYVVEIIQVSNQAVRTARVQPMLRPSGEPGSKQSHTDQ